MWGGALVVGCSEWGCSLELLQAASARAETKHIANSQANFLVWFFMSFLRSAAGERFEPRTPRAPLSRWFSPCVSQHGESYSEGNRNCRHRWTSHTHGCRPGQRDSGTSNPLEVAVALPVGHGVVEGPHLQPRGVRVKIDDRVTERPAGELAALEQVGGFMQRFRQAGQICRCASRSRGKSSSGRCRSNRPSRRGSQAPRCDVMAFALYKNSTVFA